MTQTETSRRGKKAGEKGQGKREKGVSTLFRNDNNRGQTTVFVQMSCRETVVCPLFAWTAVARAYLVSSVSTLRSTSWI